MNAFYVLWQGTGEQQSKDHMGSNNESIKTLYLICILLEATVTYA